MNPSYVLLLAFLIGVVSGLRSLTAPAVVAWGARLGWLNLANTRLAFLGSMPSVIIFSLLAVLELIADQLPSTPARTKPPGLIARIVLGGLSGAALALGGAQSLIPGALLGAAGGIVGAFAGYQARTGLVKALKVPDIVIALIEDAVAIAGAIVLVRL